MSIQAGIQVRLPPEADWGPAFAALRTDQQRLFVLAMAVGLDQTNAVKAAGYKFTKEAAIRVHGHWLMHSQPVLDALHEVTWKRLNGLAIRAVGALESIVEDKEHPKHLIAVQMVLDRTGFAAQTEHKVTVEHKMDDLQMKALAARFAADTGVPAAKLLGYDAIDGEFEEVSGEPVSHET